MGRDFIFNKEQKRRIELINLIIYTVYVLAMAYILIQNNWPQTFPELSWSEVPFYLHRLTVDFSQIPLG